MRNDDDKSALTGRELVLKALESGQHARIQEL